MFNEIKVLLLCIISVAKKWSKAGQQSKVWSFDWAIERLLVLDRLSMLLYGNLPLVFAPGRVNEVVAEHELQVRLDSSFLGLISGLTREMGYFLNHLKQ